MNVFLYQDCSSNLVAIKTKKGGDKASLNVVLGGFEPPQTEPKPVVLPLHHRTMWMQSYNFLQKQPNETAFFLDPRNDYAVLRGQKEPFISHLSVFQNINFH